MYGGRPGDLFGDLVLRSSDGGRTWGDATRVDAFLNPHESNLAVDPRGGERILLMTRCQRASIPDEDPDEFMARTGNPDPPSSRGSFSNRPTPAAPSGQRGGPTGMDTGGSVYFAPAAPSSSRTRAGTGTAGSSPASAWTGRPPGRTAAPGDRRAARRAEVRAPARPPGHSFTTPTIEFEPRRFLTAYGWYPGGGEELAVNGVFWHLEPGGSGREGR